VSSFPCICLDPLVLDACCVLYPAQMLLRMELRTYQRSMAGEYLAKNDPHSSGARYQRVAT
jgi:hypothetical protein